MNRDAESFREFSLRDFVAVLFRRKWIVLSVFLASVALVLFLNSSSPTQFESSSRVLVSRGQPESAFNLRTRVLGWEEEINSEIETILSGQVLKMAQDRLEESGITAENGERLNLNPRAVRATLSGKSAVINISFRHNESKAARQGARAITQAYADFRHQHRAVPEVDAFFTEEIETLREQMDDWEQRRADFMNEEQVVRIQDERISYLNLRQQSELALAEIRADLAELEAKVEVLRGRVLFEGDELGVYAFSEGTNKDHEILFRLRNELIRERTEFIKSKAKYTEEYPKTQELQTTVSNLEEELAREVHNYLRHLEGRIEVYRAREDSHLRTLQFVDAQLAGLPNKEARLASFDRVLEQLKANYTALVNKQIQARIERTGSTDWNILVLQPAAPAVPIRVNDYVRMALIPLLSLLVGIALAFLVDGLDHSLKDAGEVESHLQLPVLGSLGRLR